MKATKHPHVSEDLHKKFRKKITVFIAGFRGTGKTTVGKPLAESLGMQFVDLDEELIRQTGRTVYDITNGGKDWEEFRRLEQGIFKQYLYEMGLIIATGGGLFVNGIINPATGKPFGEENASLLQTIGPTQGNTGGHIVPLLLTAPEDVLLERIMDDERKNYGQRPIINPTLAMEVDKIMRDEPDPEKQKEMILELIEADNRTLFRDRKLLYSALTTNVIDTSQYTVDEAVDQAIQIILPFLT